ncbi:MAG: cell division protein FtsA [Magnetococcales bacterium]|nr:cell division protein FtsA [Magnetococcales bacterium]MBF0152006.1 cell division protein FtsA [Magnetococcales bacterium]MBF0174952.1 cell division protein FtsA [Magnetococcales bacterium]MBF0346835.1 cell division protein FtsA [Magnetococcales bacterium]MBF0632906.1 cell division protein FtsA [Magnetococcales bacterium]
MSDNHDSDLIAGLDCGSHTIKCVIARISEDLQQQMIVGIGVTPSQGIDNNGMIVDLDLVGQAIHKAVSLAENMAGEEVRAVRIGLSSKDIESFSALGIIPIAGGEVMESDLEQLMDSTRHSRQVGKHVLHLLPKKFFLDKKEVKNPLGLSGHRLEGHFHVVTCQQSTFNHVLDAVLHAGLDVEDLLSSSVGASMAVSTPESSSHATTCFIDLGHASTGVVLRKGNHFVHSARLAMGGRYITSDISQIFDLAPSLAERVKRSFGRHEVDLSAIAGLDKSAANMQLVKKVLADPRLPQVIEARIEEILFELKKVIHPCLVDGPLDCIYLTGGGSQLHLIRDHALDIFGTPVSQGFFSHASPVVDLATRPDLAAAVGLLDARQNFSDWRLREVGQSGGERKKKGFLRKAYFFLKENV